MNLVDKNVVAVKSVLEIRDNKMITQTDDVRDTFNLNYYRVLTLDSERKEVTP